MGSYAWSNEYSNSMILVSVLDMLALWGDLQLERRTLRGEGRRLNQQVAKLAEDSK